jgi:phosphate transport system protein
MARDILDRKIQHLFDEILVLDSLVEQATAGAATALKTCDLKLARRIYQADQQVNTRRYELENDLMITIATQQPIMAIDLRTLASMLEVVGELERIGDYAKGIAKICLLIGDQPHLPPPDEFDRMAAMVVDMLHRAVGAFVRLDLETARNIPAEDDQVDDLYNQAFRDLLSAAMDDIAVLEHANYMMWAAHNLERMADRVTNICERTAYTVTGKFFETENGELNL